MDPFTAEEVRNAMMEDLESDKSVDDYSLSHGVNIPLLQDEEEVLSSVDPKFQAGFWGGMVVAVSILKQRGIL